MTRAEVEVGASRATGFVGSRSTRGTARSRLIIRKRKQKRTTSAILIAVGLVLVFGVFHLGSALWTVLTGVQSELSEPVPIPRPGQNINVLFLGLDVVITPDGKVDLDAPLRTSRSRTDTMILISADPVTHEASLISIPRDTRCYIPGRPAEYAWDKINHAHVFGGPQLAMRTVERLLNIPVHYYVRTNYAGVNAIVNVIGGVEIDVEKNMHYVDPYQDLYIDLQKGLQVLDGDKALQYLRYRSDGNDITRIGRQQKFIGALVDKVLSFGTVFRAQSLAREAVKHIDTNMDVGDMWQFISLASKINDPSLEMVTLPGVAKDVTEEGRGTFSYWVLDRAETDEIIDRLVWGIDKQANAEIRVRVLNGSGVSGIASDMAAKLRSDGFQVVEVGNAPTKDRATTSVVSHSTDKTISDRVVRSVIPYAPDAEVVRELLKDPPCDVTVIVGKDYSVASH